MKSNEDVGRTRYVLAQDGCGIDLTAIVNWIDSDDSDDALKALEVVKLFAKGTSLWQAHDVGKSHPIFKSFVNNDTDVILTSQTQLLPTKYKELWIFLNDCNMKVTTKRTIWKHMVNCVR